MAQMIKLNQYQREIIYTLPVSLGRAAFAGGLVPVLLPPFGRGTWAAPFGGFAAGLVLVLLTVEV